MTNRTYLCNFCKSTIADSGSEKPYEKPGFGAYWKGDGALELRQCSNAENHLCLSCIEAIKNLIIPK